MGQKIATTIFWLLIAALTGVVAYGFFKPQDWRSWPEHTFASIALGAIAVFALAQSIRTIRGKASAPRSHPLANLFFWFGVSYFVLVGVMMLVIK